MSDTDDRNNGDIKDVDVAAGRVNPADANQKLVLAYRDDVADIHIKVLNGKSGGYIANADDTEAADMYWDQNERGDVHHSAVATGDMNGDGVDEIVVAFKDSGSDLQVMVVPYVSGASHNPTPLYEYDSFTATPKYDTIADDCSSYSNKRPLDIAMGDIDGDSQDEIVVVFRGANCKYGRIELMAFDYEGTEAGKYTLSHTNFLEFEPELDLNYQYEAANNISVAVGDLDGDGTDEIAMAWNLIANQEHEDRDLYHFVSTFEYYKKDSRDWAQHCNKTGPSCLGQRPGAWHPGKHNEGAGANEVNHESWAEIATGDLDQDGNAEVVLGRYNTSTGDVEVYAFNAESGISSPYGKQSIAGDSIWDMALAVGDADGDSRWGQYYNKQCEARHEVVVNGFVHAPPFWPTGAYTNSHRTAASYGMEIGGGHGSGKSVENSVGASVEIGGEAGGFNIKEEELEVPGIKGSFTCEWKRSIKSETESATTNVVGTGVETLPPYDAGTNTPTFEGVSTVETTRWCYDYYEQRLGVMTVCTPRPEKTIYDRTIEWWYADGPEEYPDSWVPLCMNLAQGRSATQSSTYTNDGPHGEAWRAVDGNTNGDYYAGSVSATNSEPNAWWQVDLGGLQWIDAVDIWKMTNTCSDCATRLQKFWVFVTEASSFASNDPNVLKNDSTVWSHYYDPVATNPTLIHVASTAAWCGSSWRGRTT